MIHAEVDSRNVTHTWTDIPYTVLVQTDTGIRYGTEVWDINPCPHKYAESHMTERERTSLAEEHMMAAEEAAEHE